MCLCSKVPVRFLREERRSLMSLIDGEQLACCDEQLEYGGGQLLECDGELLNHAELFDYWGELVEYGELLEYGGEFELCEDGGAELTEDGRFLVAFCFFLLMCVIAPVPVHGFGRHEARKSRLRVPPRTVAHAKGRSVSLEWIVVPSCTAFALLYLGDHFSYRRACWLLRTLP